MTYADLNLRMTYAGLNAQDNGARYEARARLTA